MSLVVGIDLGTTNSLVAHLDGERPQIIPNRAGFRMTPSVVGLDKHDRLHVGTTARAQLLSEPDRTAAEVKRLMGSSERVTLGPRTYSPTEVSALILRSLAEDAERFLGRKVEEAVITVPAYFTDAQRQGTKDAGDQADGVSAAAFYASARNREAWDGFVSRSMTSWPAPRPAKATSVTLTRRLAAIPGTEGRPPR